MMHYGKAIEGALRRTAIKAIENAIVACFEFSSRLNIALVFEAHYRSLRSWDLLVDGIETG